MASETPTLCTFNPNAIPYQRRVIDLIRHKHDYTTGNLEILLSGSWGCLREDALVETAGGKVPIGDINQSMHVLSYHELTNQFAFALNSGAYPKGKDYLYRVISEHGEYVASGHHLIATSPCAYSKVSDLCDSYSQISVPHVQLNEHREPAQLLFRANVLRYWNTVASLIGNCVERIHQCGLQLPSDLNDDLISVLETADAQVFGLFFSCRKPERKGGLVVRELERDHTSESPFPLSMRDFLRLANPALAGEEYAYIQGDSSSYERIFLNNLRSLLFQTHSELHPKDLLSFLDALTASLLDTLSVDVSHTPSSILKIERLNKQEWYWDLQVPNTNNYVANGYQHHNSAKSTLMAHIGVTHAMRYPGARVVVARRSMPDLKKTIWREILDHFGEDLVEGKHYEYNRSAMTIRLRNGSEITAASWADKRYAKFRSLKISCLLLEELTENDDEDMEAFKQLRARLRRVPGIPENVIIAATNPDSPSHWVYKYWIDEDSRKAHPNRHVFYSKTEDNKFLDPAYIAGMKADLSPKEYQRYGLGLWLDLIGETIYSEYDSEVQYRRDTEWTIKKDLPIGLTFDFNIGENKPMSMACFQEFEGSFHFFAEVVIHTARTNDVLEELESRGLLDKELKYEIYGDAAGKNRDTRSSRSDYELIKSFLSQRDIQFTYQVPAANPPIRSRHNRVNAYCKSESGEVRLYFYKGCKTCDEGMRLTKLKKGGNYIEDDSKPYQHVTTAIGYAIHFKDLLSKRKSSGTRNR